VDTALFQYAPQPLADHLTQGLMRPISLFVGRVSYEKNIAAFLALDTPGTKIVCGVGPLEESLRQRYPQVRWLGVLPRVELARLYASADVFVFPSVSDTFGLVMLEAMACGTPVAGYRAEGPNAVVADNQGGCLHDDLREAFFGALAVPRSAARTRALAFGWDRAAGLFASYLIPVKAPAPIHAIVTPVS
jgi:glycosyltransferase involved in cell wall biosynthesis